MHSFLRTIGFSETFHSERDVELLLDNLFHTYDERKVVPEENGRRASIELYKAFGPNIGICVTGEMDENGFHRTGYFPYLNGTGITSRQAVSVEKSTDGTHYLGMADEGRVGISLIFFLQNAAQYRNARKGFLSNSDIKATTLAGLASEGMILLAMKDNDTAHRQSRMQYYEHHEALVEQAKNGDEEAIESLTLEDMDTYAMITRRLQHEDVYSIVDTCFMPSGLESDKYQIIGSILFYSKVQNTYTKEYMYQLTVNCNGMRFDVCINAKDLLGDPEVGRRFKGTVWLQGNVRFS